MCACAAHTLSHSTRNRDRHLQCPYESMHSRASRVRTHTLLSQFSAYARILDETVAAFTAAQMRAHEHAHTLARSLTTTRQSPPSMADMGVMQRGSQMRSAILSSPQPGEASNFWGSSAPAILFMHISLRQPNLGTKAPKHSSSNLMFGTEVSIHWYVSAKGCAQCNPVVAQYASEGSASWSFVCPGPRVRGLG